MKKIIITFISLIIGILSRAQTVNEHYYFKNLSSQNGLSQNTVSAIFQDSKGFMGYLSGILSTIETIREVWAIIL